MVYVHLAEGFEEIEALTIVDVLRRAEIDVKTVSVTGRKNVKGTHGVLVEADTIYEDADYGKCEMIVLPGGMPGAANLQGHKGLTEQVKNFAGSGRMVAAICAAPMILGKYGLIEGKKATIYPGMEDCLAGGKHVDETVVVDGNITTGMGPALAMEFALTLVRELKGEKTADEVADGLLYHRL